MSEPMILVRLDRMQHASLTAHLLTYLFSRVVKPRATRQAMIAEMVQQVTYLLHHPACEEQGQVVLLLSRMELQSVRYALMILKPLYQQWPDAPSTPLALEHLNSCLALLEQAEQQARLRTEDEGSEDGLRGQFIE